MQGYLIFQKLAFLGMLAHIFNSSTWEAEAGWPQCVQNQPNLYSKFQWSYNKTKEKQKYQIQHSSSKLDTRPLGQYVDLA